MTTREEPRGASWWDRHPPPDIRYALGEPLTFVSLSDGRVLASSLVDGRVGFETMDRAEWDRMPCSGDDPPGP